MHPHEKHNIQEPSLNIILMIQNNINKLTGGHPY